MYLLAQGGAPDFQLVYFFWEKGKVITSSKTGGWVREVSFHPKDHDVVCIVGKAIFRMCRLIEGQGNCSEIERQREQMRTRSRY